MTWSPLPRPLPTAADDTPHATYASRTTTPDTQNNAQSPSAVQNTPPLEERDDQRASFRKSAEELPAIDEKYDLEPEKSVDSTGSRLSFVDSSISRGPTDVAATIAGTIPATHPVNVTDDNFTNSPTRTTLSDSTRAATAPAAHVTRAVSQKTVAARASADPLSASQIPREVDTRTVHARPQDVHTLPTGVGDKKQFSAFLPSQHATKAVAASQAADRDAYQQRRASLTPNVDPAAMPSSITAKSVSRRKKPIHKNAREPGHANSPHGETEMLPTVNPAPAPADNLAPLPATPQDMATPAPAPAPAPSDDDDPLTPLPQPKVLQASMPAAAWASLSRDHQKR